MERPAARDYAVLRLNAATDRCWAVIRLGSGAIVADDDGKLMMRLSRAEAEARAAALNATPNPTETPNGADRDDR